VIITNRGTAKKSSSLQIDRSDIERHIKPMLGRIRVRLLTRGDIEKFQQDVATGKSKADIRTKPRGRAILSGGKGAAARSLAVLGTVLSFAVTHDLRPDNPARGVKLFVNERSERFLSFAEITGIGEALSKLEAEGVNATATAAIRLLMLTSCRRGEIIGLYWKWIDFERRCLRLPDSKTGAKTVPLGDPAIDLLRTLPVIAGCPFVFPASRGDGYIVGLRSVWEKVTELTELKRLRLHDLRHSFASVAVSNGESLYVVGKILGHRQARTTEFYAHLADDPVRAAADRAARTIQGALWPRAELELGKTPEPSDTSQLDTAVQLHKSDLA
jgi:integrase